MSQQGADPKVDLGSRSAKPAPAPSRDAWDEAADPRILFDLALNAVITMDTGGRITGWNPAAETTFGWSAAEAIGQTVAALVVPARYRARHVAGLEHYLATGEGPVLNSTLEIDALRRDGSEFPIELAISPAWIDSLGRTTFVAFIRDVSAYRAAILDQTRLREVAENAQRQNDSIIDMIVHELRSPLTVVGGYTDIVAGLSDLPEAARRPLELVAAKTRELEELVAGLLTASRISNGHVQPQVVATDLAVIGSEARDRVGDDARLRDATVTVERVAKTPITVRCDPYYTGLILSNVVGNALRYGGSRPDVKLTIRRDAAMGIIDVIDTGTGIASDQRERIFERFVRGREHTREAGTGLGLYVARMLAERQGGSLDLTASAEAKGSTFTLRLPLDERSTP